MIDPIAAATHPQPYPYYRELAKLGLHQDPATKLWIAASAEVVTAVLMHPAARVRPREDRIPAALRESSLADVFGGLVRMTDGSGHPPLKGAVSDTLAALTSEKVEAEAGRRARALTSAALDDFCFAVPVHVIGGLMGLPDAVLPRLLPLVSSLARSFAPGVTPAQIQEGAGAVQPLLERMATGPGLSSDLAARGQERGIGSVELLRVNAIGLFTQAYDATAALISNTLLTLCRLPDLTRDAATSRTTLRALVREVLRFDSPVQNTRRFFADPVSVAGRDLPAGAAVLVLVGAANRDPLANPNPDLFELDRTDPRLFTFGVGAHACPGQQLTVDLATGAVAALLEAGFDPSGLDASPAYRPSTNIRMPFLTRLASA